MNTITVSEKHGVNPAIPMCFYCHREKNEIVLAGKLPNDIEAPRSCVWDMHPCDECASYMQMGVILIAVRDGEMERVVEEQRHAIDEYNRMHGWRGDDWKRNIHLTGYQIHFALARG